MTNPVGRVYNDRDVIVRRPLARQDSPNDTDLDNSINADVCTEYQNRAICAVRTLTTAGAWTIGFALVGDRGIVALENVLAELYQDRASIDRIAHEANIDLARVPVSSRAADTWHAVIVEAQRQNLMTALAAIVMREYPSYTPLHLAIQDAAPAAMLSPDPLPIRVGRLESRVDNHETAIEWLRRHVDPGPRRRTAVALFWAILLVLWSSWMIVDIRLWYLSNPVQAIGITAAALIAALVVRWLPEADNGDG